MEIDSNFVDCSQPVPSTSRLLAMAKCFQFDFIAILVTPPYQAPLPAPTLTPLKDTAGCIEQVLSHLCTTLLLYLISLLSTLPSRISC